MSTNPVRHMTQTLQHEWDRQQSRLHKSSSQRSNNGGSGSSIGHHKTLEGMMEDLAQQIAVLESRLHVSNTVAQFLEQRAKQAQEEKAANELKTQELAQQLERLKEQASSSPSPSSHGSRAAGEPMFKTAALESQLEQAQKSLQEKSDMVMQLERKSTQQRQQIEALQKQVGETEEKLNSSYIATLDELTGQIRELQEELKESQEATIKAQEEAQQAVAAKGAAAGGAGATTTTTTTTNTASNRGNMTPSEWERKCLELESKFELTNRVAEFLQKKMVITEGERDANVEKVFDLQEQMQRLREQNAERLRLVEIKASDLDFRLHNTKRMLKFAEDKALKAEEKARKTEIDLSHQVRDYKNKHINQQRMAKFLEQKVMTIQQENDKKTAKLDEQIFDLEFKFTGKQRVCKFLEAHVEKTAAEKQRLQDQLRQLNERLQERAQELQSYKDQAERDATFAQNQQDKISELTPQVADLKSRLNVMNEVGNMLQLQVKEMEHQAKDYQDKVTTLSHQLKTLQTESSEKERQADIRISDLEFKLTDAKRVLKSLLDKYNKSQKDSSTQIATLTKENDILKERLVKAKQVVDHLQANVEESNHEQSNMGGKVSELESQLAQSARATKFLQSNMTKTEQEKLELQNIVQQLETELATLKQQVKQKESLHQEQLLSLQARVSIADRVGEFVKQNKALLGNGVGAIGAIGGPVMEPVPQRDSVTEDTDSSASLGSSESDSYEWAPLRY